MQNFWTLTRVAVSAAHQRVAQTRLKLFFFFIVPGVGEESGGVRRSGDGVRGKKKA